ncbi:NAD(P)H-binding protein [Streptomyces sp. JJ66]|uniref:SDR family oxidoreductase n=1 Tax=Streptomyces sp. JJ66 TaxID=2803843 RepID=UPI001C59A179|nr:NAD(P)H-binding protein [Streptomyces sp. JJ66]MBW1602798.1 NAD(P)H-binding protein [Streptomyces sp. JJ66]
MPGTILVTGATGTLGRPLVNRLLADGADVRVMSRRPRAAGDDRPYAWAVCDLATGTGLPQALRDVRTIVHCATHPRHDVTHTRRLLDAASAAGAKPPHLVYISIVGIDAIPLGYYRRKLAAEQLIEGSGLPWTTLRATQFHDLVYSVTQAQRRLPVVLAPAGVRFQPIEVTEVAERLAELAQSAPAGRVPEMGGPESRSWREFAQAAMRAEGWRRPVLSPRLPGKLARAFRDGANLTPDHAVGTVTFDTYLARRTTPPHP